MEDDILLGVTVGINQQQALKEWGDIFLKITTELDELKTKSGLAINSKEWKTQFAGLTKMLESVHLPDLNTKQIKDLAGYADKIIKTLSQPVGKELDKYFTKTFVDTRKFGEGINNNVKSLKTLISHLSTVEQKLSNISTSQGFSITSGGRGNSGRFITNQRFPKVEPPREVEDTSESFNPGKLSKWQNSSRKPQPGVFKTDNDQWIIKSGNTWKIAKAVPMSAIDYHSGNLNTSSENILWRGGNFKSANKAFEFLQKDYEEQKNLYKEFEKNNKIKAAQYEDYTKRINMPSGTVSLGGFTSGKSVADGFLANFKSQAAQYAAEQSIEDLVNNATPKPSKPITKKKWKLGPGGQGSYDDLTNRVLNARFDAALAESEELVNKILGKNEPVEMTDRGPRYQRYKKPEPGPNLYRFRKSDPREAARDDRLKKKEARFLAEDLMHRQHEEAFARIDELKKQVKIEKAKIEAARKEKLATLNAARRSTYDMQGFINYYDNKDMLAQIKGDQQALKSDKLQSKMKNLLPSGMKDPSEYANQEAAMKEMIHKLEAPERLAALEKEIARLLKEQESDLKKSRANKLEKIKDRAAELRARETRGELDKQGHHDELSNLLQQPMSSSLRRSLEQRRSQLRYQIDNPPPPKPPRNPKHGGAGGDGFNFQDAFNFLAFSQLSNATQSLTSGMIDAAASLEQYKRRIDIVLKNPGKSDKYFDFLLQYEKVTPYDLPEIMNVGTAFAAQEKTLKRVGETKESAVKLAGELASINPEAGILEAQRAMSRVIAGDPNGLEILRSQFNVTNETLSEGGVKLGPSGVPLQTLSQKQRVVDAINKYVTELTGGVGAEGQSTTLKGKLSTLGSQVNKTMAKVMEPLIPAMTKFIDAFTRFLELIEKSPEPIRKAIGTISLAMSGLVTAATVGSLASWGGKALGLGNLLGGAAKGAGTAAVVAEGAGAAVGGVEAGVTQAAVVGILPKVISLFKSVFKNTFGVIFKMLAAAWGPAMAEIGATGAGVAVVFGGVIASGLKMLLTKLIQGRMLLKGVSVTGDWASLSAGAMITSIRTFVTTLIKGLIGRAITGLGTTALAIGGTVISGIGALAGVGYLGYKTYQGHMNSSAAGDIAARQEFQDRMNKDKYNRESTRTRQNPGYKRSVYDSDEQWLKNLEFSDPRLQTKEQTAKNIKVLDEMIHQKENYIKEAGKLWPPEHEMNRKLNRELGDLLELRQKQNGFIKIDLEQMAEDEKRLNHEVAMGRGNVSDQAELARKQFRDLDQELKAEEKPIESYLSKEDRDKLKAAREVKKKYAGKAINTLGEGQKSELEDAANTVSSLEELGSNNRSADVRKLKDARADAEARMNKLEKEFFLTQSSQRLSNELGAKDASGRTSFQDKINNAIARKSLIDPTNPLANEQSAAADNEITSAKREKFLAENKRRIESVRQLRGEEKARLREISLEEKAALIQQTGYAEDKETRLKAFAKERAEMEAQLSGISKQNNADAYYDLLEKISKSKQAEAKFVEAMKGNEQQIRIIHETARRERLAIVQQTMTEIRNMEQKNIEEIAAMQKQAADSQSMLAKKTLEGDIADKESKRGILESQAEVMSPKERFQAQMKSLVMTRKLYEGEEKKQLQQSLKDVTRNAKEDSERVKREIQNNIYNIKLEMDKLGPGNSPEKNKKRDELRKALYIEQNKLVNEPKRIETEAAGERTRLNRDYKRKGNELDNNEKLKLEAEQRTLASDSIQRQIEAFENAKSTLEYQANKNPDEKSDFEKKNNLEQQFQAEKTILDLKKKAATDPDLNPTMNPEEAAIIEKNHKLEILNLQKKYLELYKDITSEAEKAANIERQNRIEALQAKLGEQQKNQNLEGFTMGGTYSFEELQQRDKDESELFRLKAGFGIGKKKGQDHGDSFKKRGQDHGEKGAQFEGMFGDLKDDYITKQSNVLKDTFDFSDIKKQGFEYKGGKITDKNASSWVPKLQAYVIVDLQNNGKTIQKIKKEISDPGWSPKNTDVSDTGK